MTALFADEIAFKTVNDATNDRYTREGNKIVSYHPLPGKRSPTINSVMRQIIDSKRVVTFMNGVVAREPNAATGKMVDGWSTSGTNKSTTQLKELHTAEAPDAETNGRILSGQPVDVVLYVDPTLRPQPMILVEYQGNGLNFEYQDPAIVLGHELRHALDFINGTTRFGKVSLSRKVDKCKIPFLRRSLEDKHAREQANEKTKKPFPSSHVIEIQEVRSRREHDAVTFENIVRAELARPLRTFYQTLDSRTEVLLLTWSIQGKFITTTTR